MKIHNSIRLSIITFCKLFVLTESSIYPGKNLRLILLGEIWISQFENESFDWIAEEVDAKGIQTRTKNIAYYIEWAKSSYVNLYLSDSKLALYKLNKTHQHLQWNVKAMLIKIALWNETSKCGKWKNNLKQRRRQKRCFGQKRYWSKQQLWFEWIEKLYLKLKCISEQEFVEHTISTAAELYKRELSERNCKEICNGRNILHNRGVLERIFYCFGEVLFTFCWHAWYFKYTFAPFRCFVISSHRAPTLIVFRNRKNIF